MIEFEKEIVTTADDFRELVHFTQLIKKWWVRPLIVLLTLCGTVFLTLSIMGILLPLWAGIAIAVLCAAGISVFFLRVNKLAKEGIQYGAVSVGNKRTVIINHNGIYVKGGRTNTNAFSPWETIFAAYDRKKCYIIYLTIASTFVISKSQLSLTEQYEVTTAFQKKLGKRYYKK